jgi:hypothetical protein
MCWDGDADMDDLDDDDQAAFEGIRKVRTLKLAHMVILKVT